jgi:hypothetical protein
VLVNNQSYTGVVDSKRKQLNVLLGTLPLYIATNGIYKPTNTLDIVVNNSNGTSNTYTVSANQPAISTVIDTTTCSGSAPSCTAANSCGQSATGIKICTNGTWSGCSVAAPACVVSTPACGSAAGTSAVTSAPSSNLCSNSIASSVNLDTVNKAYVWSCGSLTCKVPYGGGVAGVCGGATNVVAPIVPNGNFCYIGTASTLTNNPDGTVSWTCGGSNNSSSALCTNKASTGQVGLPSGCTSATRSCTPTNSCNISSTGTQTCTTAVYGHHVQLMRLQNPFVLLKNVVLLLEYRQQQLLLQIYVLLVPHQV